MAANQLSPAQQLARKLATLGRTEAKQALSAIIDNLTPAEIIALCYSWETFWARKEQLLPPTFRTFGGITGKGWGKTRAMAQAVNHLVEHHGKRRIGLIAQKVETVEKTMIHGESGLIATAPPWMRPQPYKNQVLWPNGAVAQIFSANNPNGIPGPQFDLGWASEIQEWPPQTREQSWALFTMQCRSPGAQLLWDANPAKDNPILDMLINSADENNIVLRSSVMANLDNLDPNYLKSLEHYKGTQAWDMLVNGIMPYGEEGALVDKQWIIDTRVTQAPKFKRTVIAMDPAISTHRRSDATGIVVCGIDDTDKCYVIKDLSDRYEYDERCNVILDAYIKYKCDCMIVEENRGGDWIKLGLKSVASGAGLQIAEGQLTHKPPPHSRKNVFCKFYIARASKGERLAPVAPLYQNGKLRHIGTHPTLEHQLCNYVPGETRDSPNSIDALVYCIFELRDMWPTHKPRQDVTSQGISLLTTHQGRPRAARQLLSMDQLHKKSGFI